MKRLPRFQREVLMLAEHGDVSILKGVNSPRKALARKGLLDDSYALTEKGRRQLQEEHDRQLPRHWSHVSGLKGLSRSASATPADPSANWYGSLAWVGAVSADGRTAYAARRFPVTATDEHEAVAIIASSIPDNMAPFFGITR